MIEQQQTSPPASPWQSNTTNPQGSTLSEQLLPQGSCLPGQFRKVELYKQILSCLRYQSLTVLNKMGVCQCVIYQEEVGCGNQPIYHLFEQASRKRLLSAQKQANNIGCNIIISKSETPSKEAYFVGKLRGNFLNDQYFLFDGGQNPKKNTNRKRKQLGFIKLEDESLFNKQVAKMKMILPKPVETPESTFAHRKLHPKIFVPKDDKQNMLLKEYEKRSEDVMMIHKGFMKNKDPQSNKPEDKTVTDLSLKVTLESSTEQKVLDLRRSGKRTHLLSIGFPLNFTQAFGFSLAVIDRIKC